MNWDRNIELHSEKIELNNEQEPVDETSLIIKENIKQTCSQDLIKNLRNFLILLIK